MTKMKERLKVSWLDHQLNLVETITDLHYKNVFCDVTIACDGQYFTAHKLILCAQSDYFRELLEMAPCRHPFIILRDTTSEVFESLMQFIYKGNVEVPRERVPALMKAGSDMKIKGLFSPEIDNDEQGAEQGTHQPPQTVFSTITGEKSVSKTPGSRDQLKGTFDRSKNLSQESYSAEDSDDSHGMMDTANEIGSPSSSPQPKAKKSGRTGKMKRSIYVSDNLTETSRISKLPNIVIEPCSEGTPMAKRHKPSSPEEIENAGEDDAESPEVAEVECVPTFNIPLSHNVKVEPGQSYEKKSAHDTQDDCNSSDRSIHSGEPLVEERGAEDGMDQNAQFQSSVAPGGIRTDISKEDLKMEEAFLDFPPEMDLVFDVNEDESKPGSIDTHTPHPSHKPPRDLSLPSTSSSNNKPVTDAGESSKKLAREHGICYSSVRKSTASDPTLFSMPYIPPESRLGKALAMKEELNRSLKSQLLHVIYESFREKRIFYPGRRYALMATELLRAYPYLQMNLPFESAKNLWVRSLRSKFTNETCRNDRNEMEVIAKKIMKKNPQIKKAIAEVNTVCEIPNYYPSAEENEDLASIHSCEMWMIQELKKENKDIEMITKNMDCTFKYRRRLLFQSGEAASISASNILEKYPCLRMEWQAILEVYRLFGEDHLEAYSGIWGPFSVAVANAARAIRSNRTEYMTSLSHATNIHRASEMEMVNALGYVALLTCEDPSTLIGQNVSADTPFILIEQNRISIYVDGNPFLENVSPLVAVYLWVASFYFFKINVPSKISRTFNVLQKIIYNVPKNPKFTPFHMRVFNLYSKVKD